METDEKFIRGLFRTIVFLLTTGVIGYGLYAHDWSLITGTLCGVFGAIIIIALKETK